MNIQTILKVLKTERECIARQSDITKCDRRCGECDLCLSDEEILAVYDHLIEEKELEYKFASRVDEEAKAHFKGICPYTDKKCDTWTCGICEVEEREREYMESEDIE